MFLTPSYIVSLLVSSLVLGSMYALLAIGMSIIYGILRLINFAHGAMFMFGAYVFFLAVMSHVPIPIAILLMFILGGLLGVAIDTVAYRPLRNAPEVAMLITSLGVYIFAQNFTMMVESPQPKAFPIPPALQGMITIGGISIRVISLFTIVSAIALMVAIAVFVRRVKVGIAMRAIAENLEAAELMGINVNRVIMATFAFGSAVAAFTGFLWGCMYGEIDPTMGFMPAVIAFVASVVGGIGSIEGAVIGGYILGFSEIFLIGLLPPSFGGYKDGIAFALLILILLIKPTGLLGVEVERV